MRAKERIITVHPLGVFAGGTFSGAGLGLVYHEQRIHSAKVTRSRPASFAW